MLKIHHSLTFQVEQVGPSIQKTAKAKSDDCIPLQRPLGESFTADAQGPEFSTTEGATLKVEKLTVKESENSELRGANELSGSLGSRNGAEKMKCAISQDVQKKGENCSTRNVMNSHGKVAVRDEAEKNLQSHFAQFTAALQHGPDTASSQDYFGDATFVVKFTDNVSLKCDIEKYCACEEVINKEHSMEQSLKEVGNKNSVAVKSEMAFSSCSAMENDSSDVVIIKEVVQDLVNYVVYEVNSFFLKAVKKISFLFFEFSKFLNIAETRR